MPYDHHGDDEDQQAGEGSPEGKKRRFHEFDCPECSANNPWDEGFGDKDEMLCNYCGESFEARVDEEGRLRLKLL